jgi:dTDP-4-amino-4,6-dideoxygalactose transaminase
MGRELEYVQEAIAGGRLAGNSAFTHRCQAFLEETLDVPKVLLTPSCTHALEMCSLLLSIGEGDDIIVPSFTFVSTPNAFALHGARPVFCDVRPDTLNLDERRLESLITPRTKAIIPVHYAGVGCEMEDILALGEEHGVAVVEDNAHGLFGRFKGQFLGTFGAVSTLSFHNSKNFTCGEGGALVINDPSIVERAEIIREKGTDRTRFLKGQVDKYTWVDVGSSFLLGEILAAFLMGQIEVWPRVQQLRRERWQYYWANLSVWAEGRGISLPFVPDYCEQAYHNFFLLLPTPSEQEALTSHLRDRGITGVFHYQPLNTSAMGRKFGGRPGDCPVAEDVSARILRLPFYSSMDRPTQERIVTSLLEW